ncbi:hypothetical protein L211DRAFT_782750 [Terfezia boudieri ATCC MYA-4762]|uniref:SEC7 domain-containing protein n=1 Tax=Terfezia boudieri ATCC MYA-4762 TaxID=1051890 RepID=A0A3N4LRD4_9PEZI|nr:hypothetical protein L211DRAFT_782750 [Terfezia boudieri ATCC MYA-4762]
MNPYLRTPAIPAALDLEFEPEPSHIPYNATIRTVPATDPGSPPQRPTYFGESRARRDSETHFASSSSPSLVKTALYSKDSKSGKAHSSELTLDIPTTAKKILKEDRPQTSPNSPLSLSQSPTEESMWLPQLLAMRKSVDNVGIEKEKKREIDATSTGKPFIIAQEKPIATVKDIELQHAQLEQKRRESRGSGPLNVDVNMGTFTETSRLGSSWLATQTPLSTGSSVATPTVMLQVEVGGDVNDTESESADLSELLGGDEATENEKMFVKKIFDGDEEFVTKARAAAWLGALTPAAERARRAYMDMFDFSNMNILSAVRMLCGKLVLKGETQQVDRIVDAFSKRWCECNPNNGFKSADVVHTILYSLLLLNTDLHMVDVPSSQKMTRGQFLKNTMATIRRGLVDVPGTPLEARPAHHTLPNRSSTLLASGEALLVTGTSVTFPLAKEKTVEPRTSLDFGRSNRNSTKPGCLGNVSPRLLDDPLPDYDMDGGLALVNAPIAGGIRMWETQVEIILKDFYSSVKATALPLHGASKEKVNETYIHSGGALSVFGSGMLRRSPSTISKAGSERNESSGRLNTKWTAKNRSRPKLYNGSYAGSSRTSLEDRSLWSPSASSTWSKYSLDKTQTSMSATSLGSVFGHADYQQSIGFANALSHAIIREEASGTTADEASSAHLEDDGLELAGAPWAKEGMIKHKHHLEGLDKKAKNRVWTECFAVITKGNLKMFLFNTGKSAHSGGVVGGGNWTENAQPIGTFLLRHTIASALPSPGYSKTRPHVWALSLPNGAVHLFQAGTEEIIKEWVTTANYWSARLSKEPLVGGVSNVEYGWGECIADIETTSTTATFGPRPSLQESIRSSIDHGSMVRPRLPGDKVVIAEWTPPGQSMMASPLSEADQLKALETYVANINMELVRHNDLRGAMMLAFSPRHPNHTKALANWERKSSYLLREIVKFRTYIDSLTAAAASREKLREEERNRETMSVMTT